MKTSEFIDPRNDVFQLIGISRSKPIGGAGD
jgi:hypothetical protein